MLKSKKGVFSLVIVILIAIVSFISFYYYNQIIAKAEIVFMTNPDAQGDIFKIDNDGKKLTNLTNNKESYVGLSISHNGKKIAYTKNAGAKWETFMMDSDGSNVKPVEGTTPLDKVCGWSPDGKYLLLTSFRDVNMEIYCLDINTGKAMNLTSNPAEDNMPTWSPDGKRIAFISNRDKEVWNALPQLYVMELENGNVTKIQTDNKEADQPVWSPYSTDLAVTLKESAFAYNVYITDINGSKLEKVEVKNQEAYPQIWSEDGESLLIDGVEEEKGKVSHNPVWVNLKTKEIKEFQHDTASQTAYYSSSSKMKFNKNIEINITKNETKEIIKEKLALTNGNLIDGNGGETVKDSLIIVEDGVIKYAGSYNKDKISGSHKVIDLKGDYVLPGFINTHVHHGYEAYNLKEWAKQGVTTVRDLGASMKYPLMAKRDNINNHPEYARLVIGGPMITVPGGYPGGSYALEVNSPEDARAKTLELIKKGVDVIKVAYETGEIFGEKLPILSNEELKAIVDAAHENNKRVTVHAAIANTSVIETAINAGVDEFAHNWIKPVDEETLKKIVAKNMFLIPTEEVLNNDLASQINLDKFVKLGGKVALGSDYGGDPFGKEMELGMPMQEISTMKTSGMRPIDIIVAATKNASVVCGKEKEIGTIEAGKVADLFVVKGNPLDDLDRLKNVRMVIKDGCVIAGN